MIINCYIWHKIEVVCNNSEHSLSIKDAAVEVRDHSCIIKTADNHYVYGNATVEMISPYEMVIDANWFSSTYDGNGDVTDFVCPVKIICVYEDRGS